jgi:hypothetical protein
VVKLDNCAEISVLEAQRHKLHLEFMTAINQQMLMVGEQEAENFLTDF